MAYVDIETVRAAEGDTQVWEELLGWDAYQTHTGVWEVSPGDSSRAVGLAMLADSDAKTDYETLASAA